ncbi:hypothetical protein [Nocardia sp. BMG51109]|uniref:DUF7373 family lipoprotein n=1 Tax=Nocardia sp. BMG51109 TaxID=1056816 RepID=UPI00055EC93D|nr:hypothetical protein [Nocardia sp. BMG51109]
MFRSGIRGFGAAAAVLVACAALTGCGSDASGTATAAEIDVRKLEVGPYSTVPLDLRYTYPYRATAARHLAAVRLADQLATGHEIDDRLMYGTGSTPITGQADVMDVLADVNGPVAERNGLMFGYGAGAADVQTTDATPQRANNTFTTLTVMQFPSDEAASRAAREFDETDFAVAPDQNQPVALPAYPAAHSHWRPTVSTIGSTMAHGKYVINLYAGLPAADISSLTVLVEKAYSTQIPLLDALPPLSLEEMLRLPADPDGMLNRTLNPDGFGTPDAKNQITYGLRGFLHQLADQEVWRKRSADTGLDRVSLTREPSGSTSTVFRTRDSASAATLRSVILEKTFPSPADAPAGVPDSVCGEDKSASYKTKRFRCAVNYRRYVAAVEGDQLQDVHQRAAAEYALLANNQ